MFIALDLKALLRRSRGGTQLERELVKSHSAP